MMENLLTQNAVQLVLFGAIILIAGIARGSIGFGFSAIVVSSLSLWLPVEEVVTMVVLLEIMASLTLLPKIKKDVNVFYLAPLCLGLVPTTLLGVWLLATLQPVTVKWMVGLYMLAVAILTLSGYEFRGTATRGKLFGVGAISGFFGGLAAVGGIFTAWGLVGLKSTVRNLRATMAIYFLFSEAIFLAGAALNHLLTLKILVTALCAAVPLVAGIWIGSGLFSRFSEATLKKAVLVGLIVLSTAGLIKTIL